MNVTDEIRRTLSDPKPLYALAGAGDLAAEKLKDAPERLREAPTLLAEAGATLTTIANKLAAEAPERLAKVTSTVQGAAGKGRPDTAALRDRAQSVAIQQVGRLLEAAGKAVETYDELAERGKVVIERYTGVAETVDGEPAPEGPVTVLVEQVTEEDVFIDAVPETAEQAAGAFAEETAAEAAGAFETAADAETGGDAAEGFVNGSAAGRAAPKPKPAARKSTPRKRAAAPKAPRAPKD